MSDDFPQVEVEVDLFGNPIEPMRDRRGRPSFKKDKENQDFVAVRAAAGWTHEAIASAIGCDAKTLRKHFSRELDAGALIVEGVQLDVLMHQVRQGKVPAIKTLSEMVEKGRRNRFGKGAAKPSPASEAKGKKEQKRDAAEQPSTGWASRLEGKAN